jgi:hypothetical protein
MDIRRVGFVLVLSFLPASTYADRHFADLMAGPFFVPKGSHFKGWQASGSWPINPCVDLSLVGTFGRYKGTETGDDADHTLATYIIGGRWTHHWNVWGFETLPFFQALGGGVDNIRELPGDVREVKTHAILVLGIGIQPGFKKEKLPLEPGLRWRIQVDVLHRWEKTFRRPETTLGDFKPGGFGFAYSVGLMYQFGPEFTCKEKTNGRKQRKVCAPPLPPPSVRPARLVPAERRGPPAPGERIAIDRP